MAVWCLVVLIEVKLLEKPDGEVPLRGNSTGKYHPPYPILAVGRWERLRPTGTPPDGLKLALELVLELVFDLKLTVHEGAGVSSPLKTGDGHKIRNKKI